MSSFEDRRDSGHIVPDSMPDPSVDSPSDQPRMHTILRDFSETFDNDFAPILGPLEEARTVLDEAPDRIPTKQILPEMRELAHQIRVLNDKIAEQQAYVLIFGPLKSGKSTFMNAICSSYVSEVSSLPAYPCIVNVTDSPEPEFLVTRYDGRSETYHKHESIQEVLANAHVELTERIRRIEQDGEDFDPAVHMPEAIRKIDVKLPTGDLKESGAVLVDTPGLYTRMKFGYDRMTREFRDAAACAIFIVKSDNLFLEQVFSEFNELLKLFSRVFLIVNIDASKKDLQPDGTLTPSLEHEDPQKVVDAFKSLSMSAPLKEAFDSGRLNIYPVDLLNSAAERIRRTQANGNQQDYQPEAVGEANFEELLTDLTDYLNSNEYLREFVGDSIRRARSLLDDLNGLISGGPVQDLKTQMDDLEQQKQQLAMKMAAGKRLGEFDAADHRSEMQEPLARSLQSKVEEIRNTISNALTGAIDRWFDSDESLEHLNSSQIQPLLKNARDSLVQHTREQMRLQVDPGTPGSVPEQIRKDADRLGLDLGAITRTCLEDQTVDRKLAEDVTFRIQAREIPVRRRFWDYLLLRTRSRLRRSVFGPTDSPEKELSSDTKSKRLGEPAKMRMCSIATDRLDEILGAARDMPKAQADQFLDCLSTRLDEVVTDLTETAENRYKQVEEHLSEAKAVQTALDKLSDSAETAEAGTSRLHDRYAPEGEQ
ncbi:MAG: dynamin family protein [Phycisphaerae bacterium]